MAFVRVVLAVALLACACCSSATAVTRHEVDAVREVAEQLERAVTADAATMAAAAASDASVVPVGDGFDPNAMPNATREAIKAIHARLDDMGAAVDTSYILHCAFLIFFMKAGFIILEYGACGEPDRGLARHAPLRSDLISFKLLDTCVAALAYFTLGFNVFTTNKFDWLKAMFGTMPEDATFLDTTGLTWMLHYGFAQDTATIVTGAVIGRIDVRGYLLGTFLIVAILQPLVARWVWTTGGGIVSGVVCPFPSGPDCVEGRLGNGFLDFAGATVVHMVGGVSAFAAAIFVGEGRRQTQSDTFFACLGALVLWFGWYGFNTGAAGGMVNGRYISVAHVAANMTIATAMAGLVMFLYDLYKRSRRAAEPSTDLVEEAKPISRTWLLHRRIALSAFAHGKALSGARSARRGVGGGSGLRKAPSMPEGVQFDGWNQSARDLADRYLLVAEFAMRYNQVMLILMEAMQTASRVFMLLGFELSHLELRLLTTAHAARTFADTERARVEHGAFRVADSVLASLRTYARTLRHDLHAVLRAAQPKATRASSASAAGIDGADAATGTAAEQTTATTPTAAGGDATVGAGAGAGAGASATNSSPRNADTSGGRSKPVRRVSVAKSRWNKVRSAVQMSSTVSTRDRAAANSPELVGMLMNIVWAVKVISGRVKLPQDADSALPGNSSLVQDLMHSLREDPTIARRATNAYLQRAASNKASPGAGAGTTAIASPRGTPTRLLAVSAANMLGCLRAVELTAASASVVHTSREACSEERLTRQLFRFCQWKRKRGKGIAASHAICATVSLTPRLARAKALRLQLGSPRTPASPRASTNTVWFTTTFAIDKHNQLWELGSARSNGLSESVAYVGTVGGDSSCSNLASRLARELLRRVHLSQSAGDLLATVDIIAHAEPSDTAMVPTPTPGQGFKEASDMTHSMPFTRATSDSNATAATGLSTWQITFGGMDSDEDDDGGEDTETDPDMWTDLSWADVWINAPLTRERLIRRMDVGEWIGMTNRLRTMPAEQDELTQWAFGQRVHVTGLLPSQVRVLYFLGYRWKVRWEDCDLNDIINALLAGLVAITACANVVPLAFAPLVGVVAVPFYLFGKWFERKVGVFDLCSAFPVHGMGGICGLLCVGVFGAADPFGRREERYSRYFNHPFAGTWGSQVLIQFVGAIAVLLSIFIIAFVFYWMLWSLNILALEENVHEFPKWWHNHCCCCRGRVTASGRVRGGCAPFRQWCQSSRRRMSSVDDSEKTAALLSNASNVYGSLRSGSESD